MLGHNPFGSWCIRAFASVGELRFPSDEVNEAAGMLTAALGPEWLNEQVEATRGSWDAGLRAHPLGTALQAGGDHQVLEVLELAAYFRALAAVPGAMRVIPLLKTHYYSARFHLAVAARLAGTTASSIVLEPPSSGGLAGDVSFKFHDNRVQAECYRPTVITPGNMLSEIQLLTRDGLAVFDSFGPVSIGIRLQDLLTGRARKQLVGALKGIRRELEGSREVAVYKELDYASISVGLTTEVARGEDSRFHMHPAFRPAGDPQFFTRIKYATRSAFHLQQPDLDGPSGSHLGIWLPDGHDKGHISEVTAADSFSRLARKISKKLPQTRGRDSSERLMFVETPLVRFIESIPESTLSHARREFFEKHTGVGGVVLMGRKWNEAVRRHEYAYEPIINAGQHWLAALCGELIALEATRRFPMLV